MVTNLLKAIYNLAENPNGQIRQYYSGVNRVNSMGEALECYIRDLFCGSLDVSSESKRSSIYSDNFSYLGNANNPPDMIIRGGDAIEVKKVEGMKSGIALNSSYPKNKLYANSQMITKACRECEDWSVKDIIYAIGVVKKDVLKVLWFIYGDCYAADKKVYEKVIKALSFNLKELYEIGETPTREIAKIKKVDPLGITDLRVRGMWHIASPSKVYSYLENIPALSKGLSVNVIMTQKKYLSFSENDRGNLENIPKKKLNITNAMLKAPDNRAKLVEGKLITFRG